MEKINQNVTKMNKRKSFKHHYILNSMENKGLWLAFIIIILVGVVSAIDYFKINNVDSKINGLVNNGDFSKYSQEISNATVLIQLEGKIPSTQQELGNVYIAPDGTLIGDGTPNCFSNSDSYFGGNNPTITLSDDPSRNYMVDIITAWSSSNLTVKDFWANAQQCGSCSITTCNWYNAPIKPEYNFTTTGAPIDYSNSWIWNSKPYWICHGLL